MSASPGTQSNTPVPVRPLTRAGEWSRGKLSELQFP